MLSDSFNCGQYLTAKQTKENTNECACSIGYREDNRRVNEIMNTYRVDCFENYFISDNRKSQMKEIVFESPQLFFHIHFFQISPPQCHIYDCIIKNKQIDRFVMKSLHLSANIYNFPNPHFWEFLKRNTFSSYSMFVVYFLQCQTSPKSYSSIFTVSPQFFAAQLLFYQSNSHSKLLLFWFSGQNFAK